MASKTADLTLQDLQEMQERCDAAEKGRTDMPRLLAFARERLEQDAAASMCNCIYELPTLHQKGVGNCINTAYRKGAS
jgi:hypothetical protein